ncbi:MULTISPECIES: beta-ketoacyl-ACP synthase II [unclassified Mesotoga]|uniref:beta-ketoacyl-ACP synthase II n=1 Tax=unclassified Mesotoga TaxID=1184398 RepID=UPI000EF1B735|nr:MULTISPECIES: beta-ketoacyl-ACP synthase II [unclassified Mesotoga]MDI9369034.1 beta-ketoacyl-ACP synthase II [Thermotogota bacterium]NLT45193.1 beta-ketoacyl-ACP synthase II [Thermotogaceae bacterium]MDD3680156.1 beta-ketoacyl-ACP synthase II [Mesotoga sp.]MDD4206383.1 beta-ketoacyl-ACP synthase II [Mesotoga sp.]MDD4824678.1 beta-ketoacyl-ACP synthase II [Mesotoga sp.]
MRRVVVTGMGIISSIGSNLEEFWESLKSGRSGIDWIDTFDVSEYGSKVAGRVKNFDPTSYMEKREAKRTARFVQMAIASASEAYNDSGLEEELFDSEMAGVIYGVGLGGMDVIEDQHLILMDKGPSRITPFLIPMTIANMAPGLLAIRFGFKGTNFTISTACASGTNAIGEATRLIRSGVLDVAMTGGTEATITPLALAGFSNMTALSRGTPESASRPFDSKRDGFVMAEGSATLIIEEYERALRRGARIYGEIVGYGSTDDAFHITSPEESGDGAYRAMKMALKDACVDPSEVDYINAHGTSTPLNDVIETRAIKRLYGIRESLNISSTKSMAGHALGAAGAIESVATFLSIRNSFVPPTINYSNPDPECDLNYTPNFGIEKAINFAMKNSFGFGGHNASLLFKRL